MVFLIIKHTICALKARNSIQTKLGMRESSKTANIMDKVRRKIRLMAYFWFIFFFEK